MFLARCSNCETKYKLPDRMEGRKVRCAKCQTKFRAYRDMDELAAELESHRVKPAPQNGKDTVDEAKPTETKPAPPAKPKPKQAASHKTAPPPQDDDKPLKVDLEPQTDETEDTRPGLPDGESPDEIDTVAEGDGFIFDDDDWADEPEEKPGVVVRTTEPKGHHDTDFEYTLKEEDIDTTPKTARLGATPAPPKPPAESSRSEPEKTKHTRHGGSPKADDYRLAEPADAGARPARAGVTATPAPRPKKKRAETSTPSQPTAAQTEPSGQAAMPKSNWSDPMVVVLTAGLVVLSIATIILLYLALR